VQPVTVTTPDEALSPAQDDSVPPEAARVIVADDVVTTLPLASSTFTTGFVVNAEPEVVETGWVVNTSFVAGPATEGEKVLLVAEASPLEAAVKV
jgi:uncharacterized 2Fe-2S/4Fe-4S cluster protein (DUF4445 family)